MVIAFFSIVLFSFQANFDMQYFDEAADDFRAVLKLEPDNYAAQHRLGTTLKKQAEGAARERSMFAGMFSKFAKQDLAVC